VRVNKNKIKRNEMNNIMNFMKWYFKEDETFYIFGLNNKKQIEKFTYKHNLKSFEENIFKLLYHNTKKGKSLYFTFNPFNINSKSRCKDNVESIKSIIFDFDDPLTSEEDIEKLLKHTKKKCSYILETSKKKFQICYKLKNEITNKEEFEEFERVNKTLSKFFNSDTNVNSIEKLFRLPFTINQKNGFTTRFKEYNDLYFDYTDFLQIFNTVIRVKEFKEFYDSLKEVKKTLRNTKKKDIKTIEINNDFILNNKSFYKYIGIKKGYEKKYNKSDYSSIDILYIENRKKTCNDYNLIFNEIIQIRNKLNQPLKRDMKNYYNDRYNIFLK